MAEDLFRLCVIRPPLSPDPRYPPIKLGQDSDFQVGLGRAVSTNPTDPRKGLEDASTIYIASVKFAALDVTDANNVKLEKAAKAIDDLTIPPAQPTTSENRSPGGTGATEATAGTGTGAATTVQTTNHDSLVKELKKAFDVADLAGLPTVFDPLEERLKDSIVALRLLGIEQTTGNLATLTRRLRTIEVIRKTLSDLNFPLNEDDLQRYDLRPLLAPTFAELQSILSTATARAAAAKAEEDARNAAQARIDELWKSRLRLSEGLKNVVLLPPIHRKFIDPKIFQPSPAPIDMTHLTLANQHLQLVNNLAKLTLTSFERGLNTHVAVPRAAATMTDPQPESAVAPEAAVSSFTAIASPLVSMSKTLLDTLGQVPKQPQQTPALTTGKLTPFALLPNAPLPETTKSLFKDLNLDLTAKPIDSTVHIVKQHLAKNAQDLDAEYAPYTSPVSKVQYVGGLKIQHQKPALSLWTGAFLKGVLQAPRLFPPDFFFPRPAGRVNILGVADLLVIKQQLVGYEGGDVAYIENILKGETKTREVDTLTAIQTEVTNETETTDSKETDTTTAERFEVSNESDKTIKEDESAKAGVTVSASYGPTVSVSANASFSSDRNQSESTKAASRYSKDVTAKATEKIARRVLQRTITRTTTETTTKDVHSLVNTAPNNAHISGVYQWLNKVYEAQMWNYGKRTMLDFMIPEPGAFYLDKQTDPHETSNALLAVPPFAAQPTQLDAESAIKYGVQYGVTDLDPPPQEMSRASASYAAGKDEPHAKADKIPIPAGFQVSGISATASGVAQLDKTQNWVIVTCVRNPPIHPG